MVVRWKDKADIGTLADGDKIPVTDVSETNPSTGQSGVDKHFTPAHIRDYLEGESFDTLGVGGALGDVTNRLSVTTPAALFNRETDDIQIKLNKQAAADTASHLFQTAFSTRAEFGTVGSDDFVIKVSADGAAFTTGVSIDKDDGAVTLPVSATTPLIQGGTGSGDDLRLTSTSNATKGTITIGSATSGWFWDETNSRMSINSTVNTQTLGGTSYGADILVHNENNSELCLVVSRYSAAATAPACFIGTRARGSIASPAVVQSGDRLALFAGYGHDGTDYALAGTIELYSAGTPGANDMPGEWRFSTVPDGSQTAAEAMRINSDQSVQFSSIARPDANDGAALGTATVSWSDFFLASGGVINWNNGNVTLTHSADTLTLAGGGLVLPAGEAAKAPIKLTSGTNLTTPEAGALEYDGKILYGDFADSQRGVMATEQFIALTSNYTLTSTTSTQKLFNAPANGALTVLGSTTYFFECLLLLSSMSATSGNFLFDVLGAGTATLTSTAWIATGFDQTTLGTAGAFSGSATATNAGSGNIVTAAIGTGAAVLIKGILRINAAGTIIPSIGLTTAAAAVVNTDSYFRCNPVGSNTAQSVGAWS
jgi:hypothetical protein